MSKRFQITSGILLVALTLVACGRGETLPPSASKPAAELRVTEQREIEIEGHRVLALSPDGKWLATVATGQILCILKVESLTEQACVELETGGLDLRSVVWSPDSTRVAFTEDVFRLLIDSDLWVLEVESSALTNLTDDGVSGNLLKQDEILADTVPAWSPDSKTLLFARSVRAAGEWSGTALYRIPASGGDPEKLLSVTHEEPMVVWYGSSWSSDGKEIFYTVASQKRDAPANGLWVAKQDGQDPRQLLGVTDPEMGPPFMADVSAKGDKALIWYYMAAMQYAAPFNVSYFALLDLETGEAKPLKQATGGEGERGTFEFIGPANAIFAPDGSKILYTYRDADGETRLVVRDVDGETENVLFTDERPLGSYEFGLGLDWAENDTIYVATIIGSGLLLSLVTE